MRVAIIDDGINTTVIKTKVKRINVDSDNNCIISSDSHATICAKIIEKHLCLDLFYDIKFINSDGVSSIEELCCALKKCLSIEVDIINISNGIELYYEDMPHYKKLYDLCRELKNKGVTIYAAQSNTGRKTIPAHFPFVISVEQISLKDNALYYPYRHSDIYLNGRHALIINGERLITEKCNSYACAYATALLGKTSWFNSKLYKKLISSVFFNNLLLMIDSMKLKKIDVPIIYIKARQNSMIYQKLNKELALNGFYPLVYRINLLRPDFLMRFRDNAALKSIQNKIHGDIILTNYLGGKKRYDAILYELPNENVILKISDNTEIKLSLSASVAYIIEYFS